MHAIVGRRQGLAPHTRAAAAAAAVAAAAATATAAVVAVAAAEDVPRLT